jgi:hypothetical protein
MTIWLHSTVLAAVLAATAAVGVAGATYYGTREIDSVKKSDRLAVLASNCHIADVSGSFGCGDVPHYVTVEDRSHADENISVLIRKPAP